jgi:hypothetical protein
MFPVAAPPPLPPLPPPPIWHLPARCEEGDVNALFQWEGVWHLFQQWRARISYNGTGTSIGHAVSRDLLHFTRLDDALSSGPTVDQQCFDGSASITSHGPLLMIDDGCGLHHPSPGETQCMESEGHDTGGVTARPTDLGDANLTVWSKAGPTRWQDCNGSYGPSPVWRNAVTGKHQLVAGGPAGESLFEATDDTLTSWANTRPALLPLHGGGGAMWHPMPRTVEGVPPPRTPRHTHILQLNQPGRLPGATSFSMLRFDDATSTASNLTDPVRLDAGAVTYGTLSSPGGTSTGGSQGDSRTLHVSWLPGAAGDGSGRCEAANIGSGTLSSLRDLRYDPRLGPHGWLVEAPISEYKLLRGAVPIARQHTSVRPAAVAIEYEDGKKRLDSARSAAQMILSLPAGVQAADVELNITLASLSGGAILTIGIGCARDAQSCGARLQLEVRADEISLSGGGAPVVYPLLPGEALKPVPLRIMLDTRSAEAFAHGGRGAWSGGMSYTFCAGNCNVSVLAATATANVTAVAWAMASIWG